jgi:hypothetical protein
MSTLIPPASARIVASTRKSDAAVGCFAMKQTIVSEFRQDAGAVTRSPAMPVRIHRHKRAQSGRGVAPGVAFAVRPIAGAKR